MMKPARERERAGGAVRQQNQSETTRESKETDERRFGRMQANKDGRGRSISRSLYGNCLAMIEPLPRRERSIIWRRCPSASKAAGPPGAPKMALSARSRVSVA